MREGKLILLEGTDGSGKETQAKRLVERLSSLSVACVSVDFPQYGTPFGRIIGQCYLGKDTSYYGWKGDTGWFGDPDSVDPRAASALYAGDRRMARPFIEKSLEDGKHVILDRYVEANKGHQGGKIRNKEERLKMYDALDLLEYGFMELPRPDLIAFLHMPTDVSLELKKKRSVEISEKLDGHEGNVLHLRRSEAAYLELADLYGWMKIKCAPDGTINSLKTPDEIHEEIWEKVSGSLI